MTYTIDLNDIPTGERFAELGEARKRVKEGTEQNPKHEFSIYKGSDLVEVWIGDVTFRQTTPSGYVAYSDADIDSIGSVIPAGTVFQSWSRGTDVGTFMTLAEAGAALHEFAKSDRYRSG